jgi:ABC-type dipeptide/oligopeptide/nickel transport system ATPase component
MKAIYTPSKIPELVGNPFAEALPLRLTTREFYRVMAEKRTVTSFNRKEPAAERLQLVATLNMFFVPMERHLDLYDRVHSLIQKSYIGRNPIDQTEWKSIKRGSEEIVTRYRMPPPRSRITCALIGLSGSGKSTVADRICALFPEKIVHSEYQREKVGRIQVPILRVGAHKRSSISDICLQILDELDRILGTNYRHTHGRQNIGALISAVARLVAIHAVAIIVLDELQELAPSKSGGIGATASVLLHLSNTVKCAVLMVGTPRSHLFSHPELHYIVRSSGIPEWRPLKRNPREWKRFLKTLWQYQYTATETVLSDPLDALFFELSRGIPDLAIRIYQHAQTRAILHPSKEHGEEITVKLVSEVANEDFAREMEALEGLDAVQSFSPRASDLPSPERDMSVRESLEQGSAHNDSDEGIHEVNIDSAEFNNQGEQPNKVKRLDSLSEHDAIDQLRLDGVIKPGLEFQKEESW